MEKSPEELLKTGMTHWPLTAHSTPLPTSLSAATPQRAKSQQKMCTGCPRGIFTVLTPLLLLLLLSPRSRRPLPTAVGASCNEDRGTGYLPVATDTAIDEVYRESREHPAKKLASRLQTRHAVGYYFLMLGTFNGVFRCALCAGGARALSCRALLPPGAAEAHTPHQTCSHHLLLCHCLRLCLFLFASPLPPAAASCLPWRTTTPCRRSNCPTRCWSCAQGALRLCLRLPPWPRGKCSCRAVPCRAVPCEPSRAPCPMLMCCQEIY